MMIREFRPDDVDRLYSIMISSLDEYYRREVFFQFYSMWPQGQLVACDIFDAPVAFLFSSKAESGTARIMLFAVSPEHRNKGIGQEILNRFRLVSLMSGVRNITLEVRENNEGAKRFYRKNGFKETGLIPNFYQDGGNGIRMDGPVQLNF
ncbi:GNAT family N-acetyltransferase [Candidatus Methanarcanum hacksteinii]|uniref:GNAT family N-acetyltransferase n=1 Tax=Candidatus Methanarcanum hacksteinii TaxID=2911857 RepID=UPI0037DD90DF